MRRTGGPAPSPPNSSAAWGAAMHVWLNLVVITGWALSSIFVLSFTRLARSV